MMSLEYFSEHLKANNDFNEHFYILSSLVTFIIIIKRRRRRSHKSNILSLFSVVKMQFEMFVFAKPKTESN